MASESQVFRFIDICAVYFTLQLVWCVIFSYILIGFVMLLRKTLFLKLIFTKGVLWALFLIVPFLGKMKVFYEHDFLVKATWWLTGSVMTCTWISYVYMAGILISFLCMSRKRVALQRIVSRMEKQLIGDKLVYITDMNVTPFTVGLFSPKIILSKRMKDNYNRDEIEAIIQHEKTHIRLGHLWCYFIWEILRCLLWANPFLAVCQRHFRADMEDICDKVCIQNSGKTAHEYGWLLLKTVKLLKTEQDNISSVVTYAGEKEFEDIKRRIEKITNFRSYQKMLCRNMVVIAAILMCIVFMKVNSISYAQYNEIEHILVYGYNPKDGTVVILDNSDRLQKMISYRDDYVYVDRVAFETLLDENISKNNTNQEIYIVFGGFYKLPGIGSNGNSCFYQVNSDEKIVKIPYERLKDSWIMELFKIL